MKLLIVDDEELTRVGVVSSINWKSLGIDEVLQADDGVNGLEVARRCRPEIILCDVRMPRMNGIAMLEQVEQILPDTVSIFMSGYSDKEYLKAAIRLKTVNYVEKPLDPAEIQEAVLEAIRLYRQKQHSHRGEELHSLQTASRLALQLTVPYETNKEAIREFSEELGLHLHPDMFVASVIVHPQKIPDNTWLSYDAICQRIQNYLKEFEPDCICIYIEKKPQHLVYFLLGSSGLSDAAFRDVLRFIGECYVDFGNYLIAAGDPCRGISSAYHSYADAVILLQSSFFFPAGTLLTSDFLSRIGNEPEESDFAVSTESSFAKSISSMDEEACGRFLETLYRHYDGNHSLMPNQVRDLYYKLFLVLEEASRGRRLMEDTPADNIMDAIENAFTYYELHQALAGRTHRFFEEAQQSAPENPTIAQIKDYIGKNYQNDLLSVKDISSHVFLSVSYVCTYFKNETGQTLNQYLTEYRMERAKELLQDPRYKIADISSKVGYSDGNYFGKSFKKYSGLSPSEYREKMTR